MTLKPQLTRSRRPASPAEEQPEGAIHPGLAEAFAALDAAGVRWSLLRGTASLAAPEGDVDMLVAEADAAIARDILSGLGFAELPFGPPAGWGALRYDREADRWLWLDISTRLTFGEAAWQTGGEEAVLAGRRRVDGAWLPTPDDETWLLLLHLLAGARRPEDRHRARLGAIAPEARPTSPLALPLAEVLPPGWTPAKVLDLVRREAWEELARLGPDVAARVAARARTQGAAAAVPGRGRAIIEAFVHPRRFRRRMGLGVALLGPDGAGKSSTGLALIERFPFGGRQVYMGMRGGVTSPEPGGAHIPGLSALIGFAIQWGAWLVGFSHMARGRLVVFDRYTEDAFLPPGPGESRWKRIGRRIRARIACPPPDLTIVLDAPGEVMFRRKGEHSPERLERQRRRYLGLRGRLPNVVVVDATASQDDVRREATAELWRRYARRLAGGSGTVGRVAGRLPARAEDSRPDVYGIDMADVGPATREPPTSR
jgi:hypothetical protein